MTETDTNSVSKTLVTFRDVAKTYDGKLLVVDDLSVDIAEGEFLTLLGPSGSGKTTTLMMLAGFEPPTRGEITYNGENITTIAPHKRGMGMVFQNYALFPHMSVGQNIAYPLKVRGVSKAERAVQVQDALNMVKLSGFAERKPNQLSGGERQRVALARALVFRPALVLMDEPLGALDKNLREHMQYEIRALHAELGVTVVYVTHDQSEALTMSNRIAVFNDGKIQQIDAPNVLYEEPSNAFVAGFIGENNALPAELVSHEGDSGIFRLHGDGDTQVCATLVDCAQAAKSAISLSVRPERVVLNPDSADCETRISTKVRSIIYHGDHLRIVTAPLSGGAAEDAEFVMKAPTTTQPPTVGETIMVGWQTKDCRAFAPM